MAAKMKEPVLNVRGWIKCWIAITVARFYTPMIRGACIPSTLQNRYIDWQLGLGLRLDRQCNCLNPSKVNRKCVYEDKSRRKCLTYKVKFTMCDAIYIDKTQQTFKKIMIGHFKDVQNFIKNRKNRLICVGLDIIQIIGLA